MILDVVKIILPSILTFIVGILITPFLTNFLYKNKMWKKTSGKVDTSGQEAAVFNKFHKDKESKIPRMGGIVIWASIFFVSTLFWIFSRYLPFEIFDKLEFVSRNQTWIPIVAMMFGALIGLIDDLYEIKGTKDGVSGGLSSKKRLIIVGLIALMVASWFFYKLEVSAINVPVIGVIEIGFFIIPLFIFVSILIYSGGVIDGLDGLSGGVFASIFAAYAVIAFSLGQIDLAAFCASVVGGVLAFLWFNIPPARFYMTETGSMSLTIVLSIVAFMTDNIVGGVGLSVLFIIAFPLIATAGSSFIQIVSKKYRGGKKIFLSSPLHHHFEAIGWPPYKIVMRYWIISIILSSAGIIVSLLS